MMERKRWTAIRSMTAALALGTLAVAAAAAGCGGELDEEEISSIRQAQTRTPAGGNAVAGTPCTTHADYATNAKAFFG